MLVVDVAPDLIEHRRRWNGQVAIAAALFSVMTCSDDARVPLHEVVCECQLRCARPRGLSEVAVRVSRPTMTGARAAAHCVVAEPDLQMVRNKLRPYRSAAGDGSGTLTIRRTWRSDRGSTQDLQARFRW